MANTKSKKQLILEHRDAHGLDRAGAREIRAIEAALRSKLGANQKTSFSFIANVLRKAGVRVDFDDRYVDPWMEEPYASRLAGLLQFHDLDAAQSALERLDQAYREYQAVSDRVGISLVRSLVAKGRQRAEGIAVNPRVRAEKRREKEEIARWFKVWLDLPDSFLEWLEMRKRSYEFQQMFPNQHDKKNPEPKNVS